MTIPYAPVRRVAVYCRVSTLSESQEDSFETQRDAYMRMIAADPNMILADIYGDHGVSGTSVKRRPEFTRMIQDCESGMIDVIMTKSISRFSRNLADCMETVRHLRGHGIPVIFEREGINTMDSKGELLLSLLASIAQEEANNLSQNIRWAHERNNAAGKPSRPARYGYRRVDGKWVIHEDEAERVRYAFQKAADGWKYWMILDGLDDIEETKGTSVKWSKNRLKDLLKSEVYIGDILTNKYYKLDYLEKNSRRNTGQRPQHYVEDHHEPLITKKQFELVQRRIKNKELNAGSGGLPAHRKPRPARKNNTFKVIKIE